MAMTREQMATALTDEVMKGLLALGTTRNGKVSREQDGEVTFVIATDAMRELIVETLQDALAAAPAEPPAPEWRCFHCDEVFTDTEEAKKHFGYDAFLWDTPLCVIKAEEGGLAGKIRSLEAELNEACHQRDELENDSRLWHDSESDRRRCIGDRKWSQEIDYREGEKLVLQEKLRAATAQPTGETVTETGWALQHNDGKFMCSESGPLGQLYATEDDAVDDIPIRQGDDWSPRYVRRTHTVEVLPEPEQP